MPIFFLIFGAYSFFKRRFHLTRYFIIEGKEARILSVLLIIGSIITLTYPEGSGYPVGFILYGIVFIIGGIIGYYRGEQTTRDLVFLVLLLITSLLCVLSQVTYLLTELLPFP